MADDAPVVTSEGEEAAPGYAVTVDAFSGPLDLLLYLVRRTELDITEIPITAIADQFVDTVRGWQASGGLDLEVAGDFVLMASTLLEIKARTIAPPPEEERERAGDEDDDLVDPRADLIAKLLAYRRFKEATAHLLRLEAGRAERAVRRLKEEIPEDPEEIDGLDLGELDPHALFSAWQVIVNRLGGMGPRTVARDDIPIESRITGVIDQGRQEGRTSLNRLLEREPTLLGRVTTVMATLEVVRQRWLEARQWEQYGDVELRFRPPEERDAVPVLPDEPAEDGRRRRRRPPLVTYLAAATPAVEAADPASGDPEQPEEPFESDDERFLRELNESCRLDQVLEEVKDWEAGFRRAWEILHPPPPPPVSEPAVPEPVAAPVAAEPPVAAAVVEVPVVPESAPAPSAAVPEVPVEPETAAPAVMPEPEVPPAPEPSVVAEMAAGPASAPAEPEPTMVPEIPVEPEPVPSPEPEPLMVPVEPETAAPAVMPEPEAPPAPEPSVAAEMAVEPAGPASASEPEAAPGPDPGPSVEPEAQAEPESAASAVVLEPEPAPEPEPSPASASAPSPEPEPDAAASVPPMEPSPVLPRDGGLARPGLVVAVETGLQPVFGTIVEPSPVPEEDPGFPEPAECLVSTVPSGSQPEVESPADPVQPVPEACTPPVVVPEEAPDRPVSGLEPEPAPVVEVDAAIRAVPMAVPEPEPSALPSRPLPAGPSWLPLVLALGLASSAVGGWWWFRVPAAAGPGVVRPLPLPEQQTVVADLPERSLPDPVWEPALPVAMLGEAPAQTWYRFTVPSAVVPWESFLEVPPAPRALAADPGLRAGERLVRDLGRPGGWRWLMAMGGGPEPVVPVWAFRGPIPPPTPVLTDLCRGEAVPWPSLAGELAWWVWASGPDQRSRNQ